MNQHTAKFTCKPTDLTKPIVLTPWLEPSEDEDPIGVYQIQPHADSLACLQREVIAFEEDIDYADDAECWETLHEENRRVMGYIEAAVNSYQAMKEALEAISARMRGEYDHPSLVARGPLHNEIHTMKAQMQEWADQALTLANGKEPTHDSI